MPGPWTFVAGASVQGRDHRSAGRENQDAFRAGRSVDGLAIVIAVSDGAGSRERSALGSHLAVDVACRALAAPVPGAASAVADWQDWLSAARRRLLDDHLSAVHALAGPGADDAAKAGTARATAATLAAAIICPPWAAFVAVGDCFGAVLTAGRPERCHLVLQPQRDGDLTVFLSSPSARSRLRSFLVWEPELSGVVLATDGCAALAFDHPALRGLPPVAGPQPAPGFFIGIAEAVRSSGGDAGPIHDLLTGEQAARCGDDLTVLCALASAGTAAWQPEEG